VVAQGPGAGGHRATFDPLAAPADDPLDDLVAALVAGLDCPVVAAGGLATAGDVKRVRGVGATAAQIGTGLLLADEAGTNPVHRAALCDPQFDQTVITRAFTGRYARALRNRFIDEHERDAISGFPEVARMTAPVLAAAMRVGDPHRTSLWAGTAFRNAKTGSAVDIVRELAAPDSRYRKEMIMEHSTDRVAIITGASRGIGAGLVDAYSKSVIKWLQARAPLPIRAAPK
jgi:nitronate monooxygenase